MSMKTLYVGDTLTVWVKTQITEDGEVYEIDDVDKVELTIWDGGDNKKLNAAEMENSDTGIYKYNISTTGWSTGKLKIKSEVIKGSIRKASVKTTLAKLIPAVT